MTASHPIRFGVFTGVAQTTWPDLLEVWQRVDEMGFDTGWVPDHFYAGYGDPTGPCFEAGTVLVKDIYPGSYGSSPKYLANMNSRETLFTELGVLAEKPPEKAAK
jgi:hypothetical protein